MVGIYKITNLINNKIYIGKSINIEARWKEHIRESYLPEEKWQANKRGEQTYLHRAIRKYGIENFKFEILELNLPIEVLNDREKYWIQYYKSYDIGYNLTLGGDGQSHKTDGTAPGCKLTLQQSNHIKEMLKNNYSANQIKQFYPFIQDSTISGINTGKIWHDDTEDYPLRKRSTLNKFTNEEVMDIRKKYGIDGMSQEELAELFNCSRETIHKIVYNKTYTDLPQINREVSWEKVNANRTFDKSFVIAMRDKYNKEKISIKKLWEEQSQEHACSYAAFYNMITGKTYKNYKK